MKLGITHKMLVPVLFVAMIPLVSIWYINYQATAQHLTESSEQQLSGISDKLVAVVDDWVTANHKVLNQNGALPEMSSMNAKLQDPVLKAVLNEHAWSYLVFTLPPDCMNVGRSEGKQTIDN